MGSPMRIRAVFLVAFTVALTGGFILPGSAQQGVSPAVAADARPEQGEGGQVSKEKSGSDGLVVLAPTPMLDYTGKQRLDPDGRPMFNPPVKQQRDKHGHPLFEHGRPVMQTESELGFDEHGRKLHAAKEKPQKVMPVTIAHGMLMVDGFVAAAELNYQIPDLKFFYIFAPGLGTTVISGAPFPGATEQRAAFVGKTLTVRVSGHLLQISSEEPLLGKKPEPAFVSVDRDFVVRSRSPTMGYGTLDRAPYDWQEARDRTSLAGDVPDQSASAKLQASEAVKPVSAVQKQ